MVDISSQNNKINVTVTSSGNTANTNVTLDYAQYYSEKSKEWAISEKIVDNTDYSSKYYANESKKQADISTAKATEVIESGNTAVSNIENARDNAITDITNQENLSVDNVNTAGATQIALATEQANIATEQATIATNKTSEVVASGNEALSNIDTAKSEALTEIETLHSTSVTDITGLKNTSITDITTAKDNAITSITNQETTSKNNVIATGNEQVERVIATGNNYDNLTHKNITNCLLEVPQKIKLELNNGTLTIKAGSVVIVPYGVEDLTAQYPKGATFLNENFKVYDTQYADGKFFVWAEIVEDISYIWQYAEVYPDCYQLLNLFSNAHYPMGQNVAVVSGSTQPTVTTQIAIWYDTANNFIKGSNDTGASWQIDNVALPIAKIDIGNNAVTSVNQVFNGMGYIGSTVWVDKGVKGLIPNGRNADGSLRNIEAKTDSIITYTNISSGNRWYCFKSPVNGIWTEIDFKIDEALSLGTQSNYWFFDEKANYWLYDGNKYNWVDFAHSTLDTASPFAITSFNPKLPFRAVDYNDFLELSNNSANKELTNLTNGLANVICTTAPTTTSTASAQKPAVVIENYVNGTSWYRVWSDGWIEQGGYTSTITSSGVSVSLLKSFSNTNYTITACRGNLRQDLAENVYWTDKSTNNFTLKATRGENRDASWYACGY